MVSDLLEEVSAFDLVIDNILDEFDSAMGDLRDLERSGDYIKADAVFDLLLDIRQAVAARRSDADGNEELRTDS